MLKFGRLMSDYEVTLVNDNSEHFFDRLTYLNTSDLMQCMSISYAMRLDNHKELMGHGLRQEFYVRFKGPEESTKHSSK